MAATTTARPPVEVGFENEPDRNLPTLTGAASTELAVTDFGDDAGAGFENVTMDERVTPFLRMAQGLSPELNPSKGEYIPGLTLGSIFNTVSKEFYPGNAGVEIVVCWRDYHYGLWVPRDLGGGFRGAVSQNDPLVKRTMARMAEKYGRSAKFKLPRYRDGRWSDEPARTVDTDEAIELVETGHLYTLYAPGRITGDNFSTAIVPFTSTSLSTYANYVERHLGATFAQSKGPRKPAPIYCYRWRLSTFQDKNTKGEFANWRIDLVAYARNDPTKKLDSPNFYDALYAKQDPGLFVEANRFYQMARGGEVKIDEAAMAGAVDDGEGGTAYPPRRRQPGEDTDPPF